MSGDLVLPGLVIMSRQMLPDDGPLELGSVRLPSGRQVASFDSPEPVAWVTGVPVENPGRTWLELSETAAATGLQPLLISPHQSMPGYSWEDFYEDLFRRPVDPGQVDGLDAAEILRERWYDGEDDEIVNEQRAPFTGRFPGLAPGTRDVLAQAELLAALDSFGPVPLCLVPADRPADSLAVTGWFATGAYQEPGPVSAVLRTWEDRFGARLIQAGPGAELRLLVERPPRTMPEALSVTAEIWAFSDTFIAGGNGRGTRFIDVSDIAPRVLGNPLWGFWWD